MWFNEIEELHGCNINICGARQKKPEHPPPTQQEQAEGNNFARQMTSHTRESNDFVFRIAWAGGASQQQQRHSVYLARQFLSEPWIRRQKKPEHPPTKQAEGSVFAKEMASRTQWSDDNVQLSVQRRDRRYTPRQSAHFAKIICCSVFAQLWRHLRSNLHC